MRFKEDDQVECIYFSPYKGLGKIRGNVVEFTIVTKEISNEIMEEFLRYNEMHQEHYLLKKFGVKIHVVFDDDRKYIYFPLKKSLIIRVNNLYNSGILFDKNGEYLKIKQKAQKFVNILNSRIFQYKNLAKIYLLINSLLINQRSKGVGKGQLIKIKEYQITVKYIAAFLHFGIIILVFNC